MIGSLVLNAATAGRVNLNPIVVALGLVIAASLLAGPSAPSPSTDRPKTRTTEELDQQRAALLLAAKLGRDRDEWVDLYRSGQIS